MCWFIMYRICSWSPNSGKNSFFLSKESRAALTVNTQLTSFYIKLHKTVFGKEKYIKYIFQTTYLDILSSGLYSDIST